MHIERITKKVAEQILLNEMPRGSFFYKDNVMYYGIDNSGNEIHIKKFFDYQKCINWLAQNEEKEMYQ